MTNLISRVTRLAIDNVSDVWAEYQDSPDEWECLSTSLPITHSTTQLIRLYGPRFFVPLRIVSTDTDGITVTPEEKCQ